MCHFISWIEYRDVNTKEGKKLLKDEYKDDLLGHGAIRHYYPELKGMGKDCECTGFSSPKNFPDEIVKAIKRGLFRGFSVCDNILTKQAFAEYEKIKQPAFAEYKKIKQQAFAEYKKIKQPAFAEYEKIKQPAWAKYKKIEQQACAEYKNIQQQACAEYKKIQQQAWAKYKKIVQPAFAEYEKIKQSAFWGLAKQKKNRKRNWK